MTAGIDVTTKTLQRSRIWIVIGVFGLLTSACSSDVEILSAAASGDGTWLELSLNSCKRTYDVSVEEADGVSVHVVDANSKSPIQLGGEVCSDVWTFTLSEPLGDRPLLDTATGNEVPSLMIRGISMVTRKLNTEPRWPPPSNALRRVTRLLRCASQRAKKGPYLVIDMPDLGDGESAGNTEYQCQVNHLDPLRR
jgi:hypothetical protein